MYTRDREGGKLLASSHRVNKARTLAFLQRYGVCAIHAVSHKIGLLHLSNAKLHLFLIASHKFNFFVIRIKIYDPFQQRKHKLPFRFFFELELPPPPIFEDNNQASNSLHL